MTTTPQGNRLPWPLTIDVAEVPTISFDIAMSIAAITIDHFWPDNNSQQILKYGCQSALGPVTKSNKLTKLIAIPLVSTMTKQPLDHYGT